jgi:HK97 family phage prohead protease
MESKHFTSFAVKADDQGVVESIVAVMGNRDEGGDIIHPGAFVKTITERLGKIRVLDAHRTDSTSRIIGKPVAMRELRREELPPELLAKYPEANGGLWTKTQFLLDTPEGAGAFARLKAGVLDEWSIGYDALDTDFGKVTGPDGQEKTVRNLRTIKLFEYSPVLWAMNSATSTLSAKAAMRSEPDGENPAGHYLVVEDPEKVTTWHLRVRNAAGELDHRLMGAAWAALHGGYRGNVYEGPGKREAIAELTRLYADEEMDTPKAGDDPTEAKAGRVLAARNIDRIRGALALLEEALSEVEMPDDSEDEMEPDEDMACSPDDRRRKPKKDGAGPEAIPPTEASRLVKLIEIEQAELTHLLEV